MSVRHVATRFGCVAATIGASLILSLPAYAARQVSKRALEHHKSVALAQHGAGLVAMPASSSSSSSSSLHPEIEATDIRGDISNEDEPTTPPSTNEPAAPPKPAAATPVQTKQPASRSANDSDDDDDVNAASVEDLKAGLSQRMLSLPICRREGGPEGRGEAEVTFFPNGTAQVALTQPYARTESGACVARRLGGAARPFAGAPVTIRVRFAL